MRLENRGEEGQRRFLCPSALLPKPDTESVVVQYLSPRPPTVAQGMTVTRCDYLLPPGALTPPHMPVYCSTTWSTNASAFRMELFASGPPHNIHCSREYAWRTLSTSTASSTEKSALNPAPVEQPKQLFFIEQRPVLL